MKNKMRIFVDMDGTIAEWQYGTPIEELYEAEYFFGLSPYFNVLNAVKLLIRKNSNIEFFVLTAYFHDHKTARKEKNQWLDKWLPEIDEMHRIFVPCGEKKSDCVPYGIRQTDILIDDHTPNLLAWNGLGIKVLNGGNGKNGRWAGKTIHIDSSPEEIASNVEDIVHLCDDMIYCCSNQYPVSCSQCGEPIHKGDLISVCSDCGAIFCKQCALNGHLAEHSCEE